MTFSTTFLQLFHKYMRYPFPDDVNSYGINKIRKEIEVLIEKANEPIQRKIGYQQSNEDVVITKDENNQLYEVNLLYNEFMDICFN